MTTALDVAKARADKLRSADHCWIPPITDPLGACWDQPDRSEILLDGNYAVMSRATFAKLADYSCSQPSGVYVGKMWKSGWPYSEPKKWTLCWFGEHANPDYVSNNYREILLVD